MRQTIIGALVAVLAGCGGAGRPGLPAPRAEGETALDRDNLILSASGRVKPGVYRVKDEGGDGVVQITKSNIVLDFEGATLWGADEKEDPDKRTGTGIRIVGASNVTIRNARVHGFKFGIAAFDCEGLVLENCDVSRTRAQRLFSRPEKEEIGRDFLELRNVEAWETYGAGIWLERCKGARVEGCRGQEGQNGIILRDTEGSRVLHNDFRFNSGWGIGLWRATDNLVMWNLADFCLRGSWWPAYAAGSDSAGLVVVNASNRNWIVANSLTHGGDGFFLSNRKDIETPADGSCNDNVVAFNDGSIAAANAFESTFSERNVFVGNRGIRSNYAFWGGFSSHNLLLGNLFSQNRTIGVAIEQGRGTVIEGNRIEGNKLIGIELWAVAEDRPQRKENPSQDYEIRRNRLLGPTRTALKITRTKDLRLDENELAGNKTALEAGEGVEGITARSNIFDNGAFAKLLKGAKVHVDARENFWRNAEEAASSVEFPPKKRADVDAANPLPKEKPIPDLPAALTYEGGLEALQEGRGAEILEALKPYLKKMACEAKTPAALPAPTRPFKMHLDSGEPQGEELLRAGEWGPLRPGK